MTDAVIKGSGIGSKVPFILMLYTQDGERRSYECNWAQEFIDEFDDRDTSNTEVAFFFVMGNPVGISTIADGVKFCKA